MKDMDFDEYPVQDEDELLRIDEDQRGEEDFITLHELMTLLEGKQQ